MIKKISEKQKLKNVEKKVQTTKRFALFLELFDERAEIEYRTGDKYVRCFETGTKLYEKHFKENSCIYHHLLLKSKFPQYDLCKENIVIITPYTHDLAHSDISRVPKVREETARVFQLHLNDELC